MMSHWLIAHYTGITQCLLVPVSASNQSESVEPHVNNFSSIICALNKCVYCKEQKEMANNRKLKKIKNKRIW